ncbi:MBOAT family O-acyltransferase [Winogradskyella sp. PG-2]|uniref:MBOAT family O-acyltransferase n=1 Tax=Winogradskyella sp. PG-2 TaxID=754409 RepID=UPI00045881A6|nr:MBOAT family O-acyltransferase [Winogradskyella sp. PG-2]BAO74398.1 probable poly(beta-D-mannuronate) O-acetylase [Winogradskyella sp. PG-2]
MLFNSLDFAFFLPIVFVLYWFVVNKKISVQNFFLVLVSYVFYGWWDWRFLSLIIFSSLVDYLLGKKIYATSNSAKRKLFLYASVAVNIGFLGFFKYYNFFVESFVSSFSYFGLDFNVSTLKIILPVGISFYTFQTLSYTIDVYRGKLKPAKDPISFFTFVSFFPQLVAGPIERATNLLPQFYKKRIFNYDLAVSGMRLILWGFFQKIVIADGCALYVNDIFENYTDYSSLTLIFGVVLFAFQIYGDFAGYSNIAIGVSRLFGFTLMRNFNYPYFSRNIAEFWRRWHISLSTWFRDYLYIPLGGSKGSKWNKIRNVFIIFIVSGFWHGANWTFIIWGALNAFFFLPLLLSNRNRAYLNEIEVKRFLPSIKTLVQMGFTFVLTSFAWIFFRSNSVADAFQYVKRIIINNDYLTLSSDRTMNVSVKPLLVSLALFILFEWYNRNRESIVGGNLFKSPFLRYSLYFVIVFMIILNIKNEASGFIYFQF